MYNSLASTQSVEKAIQNLKTNGIEAMAVKDGAEAKAKVLEIIPQGSEVFNMTSVTLDTIGLSKEVNESGRYNSVRNKLNDPNISAREKKRLGAAPEYTIGSVHAVTEDGKIVIASKTGSQLAAYVYGADKVIWVVGAQKIVPNLDEALKRIREYVLPLESDRANKAYNITEGSFISKELIINREITPGRMTVIFVPEVLGF